MNRVHVGNFGGTDYLRNVEVAFAAARRADTNRFICKPDVQCVPIRFGIHRHRSNAKFPAGGEYAQRNFAAVCDQNFSEHFARSEEVYFSRCGWMPNSASPYSPGCPFSTKIRTPSPATSDSISFISF